MASSIPEEAGSPAATNFRTTTAQKLYSSRRVKSFDLYSGAKNSKNKNLSFTCRKFKIDKIEVQNQNMKRMNGITDSRNESFIKNASKIAIKEVVDTLI